MYATTDCIAFMPDSWYASMRCQSQCESAVSLCTNGVFKQLSSRWKESRYQARELCVCSMEPPSARMGASLSGSEDGRRVWLFGGNAGGASLNDLYCLDLETRTWSQVLSSCWNDKCICCSSTAVAFQSQWPVGFGHLVGVWRLPAQPGWA